MRARARTHEQNTHTLIFESKLTNILKESLEEFVKQSTLTEEQVVKMIEFILQATEIYEDQTLVIWLNQLTFEGRKIPYFDRLLNAPKKVIKGNNNNEPEWLDEYIKELLGHKSIATTIDTYTHISDNLISDEVKKKLNK